MKIKVIKINNYNISNEEKVTLISGPCQIESREHTLFMAENIKKICDKLGINLIFKSSFDKANRTSLESKRGLGLEKSLKIFEEVKSKFNIPVLTDVHTNDQCEIVSKYVDVLQIPAFLCRQTDLLVAAAKTKKAVNIKKGQFLAPWDMENVIKKITDTGNENVLVTERGASFGYNTLVSDMRSLSIMKQFGYPVVFDSTHSVQQPGGKGTSSGGQREFIYDLTKAAVSIGVSCIFLETHDNPNKAPSDGPNMLPLKNLESFLKNILQIDNLIKQNKI